MFGSDILEVATGIVFVFCLISTLCSSIREGLEGWLKTRASYLEFGIRELLQDRKGDGMAKEVFEHPLIFGLYPGDYSPGTSSGLPSLFRSGRNLPSYIPSRNFALALMDIAARGPLGGAAVPGAGTGAASMALAHIRANIAAIRNLQVQRALITAIDSAQGDFDQARANIENWYDSAMERVSGWYKRSTQWALFWIALCLAVGLNVNTITIADYLYRHDAERSAIVSTIDKTAASADANADRYTKARQELDQLRLPMGWSAGWGAPQTRSERAASRARNASAASTTSPGGAEDTVSVWQDIAAPVLGWLFTAFAAMLGAPFWFDVLNRIMVIRSTVKPREKSGEKASQDRQAKPVPPQPAAFVVAPHLISDGGSVSDDPCGVGDIVGTPDDQLPAAHGGVA